MAPGDKYGVVTDANAIADRDERGEIKEDWGVEITPRPDRQARSDVSRSDQVQGSRDERVRPNRDSGSSIQRRAHTLKCKLWEQAYEQSDEQEPRVQRSKLATQCLPNARRFPLHARLMSCLRGRNRSL